MARQWFMATEFGGAMVDEDGTEEYFVPGVGMINEDQAVAVAGDIFSVAPMISPTPRWDRKVRFY